MINVKISFIDIRFKFVAYLQKYYFRKHSFILKARMPFKIIKEGTFDANYANVGRHSSFRQLNKENEGETRVNYYYFEFNF